MESKWEHYRRTEARSDEIRRRGTAGVGILGRGNGIWQKKKTRYGLRLCMTRLRLGGRVTDHREWLGSNAQENNREQCQDVESIQK